MKRARLLLTLARAATGLAAMATLAVPALTYRYVHNQELVNDQLAAARISELPAADVANYKTFGTQGSRTFVVLGYHDVVQPGGAPAAPGRRSVSADVFAAQMEMLELAGFQTVSATQVRDFLSGRGSLPPHAALIAFEQARTRSWTVADPVLARHGFQAVIFVDQSIVNTQRQGSYLSWPGLQTMVASGRWSVGLALPQPTATVPADAGGTKASALLTHQWLSGENRVETTGEFESRLRSLLSGAVTEFVSHGLPPVALLSYPFQAGYPLERVTATFSELVSVVDGLFPAGLLTMEPDKAVTSDWAKKRILPRIQVYGSTTERILFSRIREAAQS